MRAAIRFLVASALLISLTIFCSADQHTFGKTHAEILKMGRDKWMDFYTAKTGGSTMDMCDAEGVFGQCLKERNDKRIARLPAAEGNRLRIVRGLCVAFGESIVDVGMVLSGGGTLWRIVAAGVPVDVEEMIEVAVGASAAKPGSGSTRPEIDKRLEALHKEILESGKEKTATDDPQLSTSAGLKAQARAKAEYRMMLPYVAGLRLAQRKAVFGCLVRLTKLAESLN